MEINVKVDDALVRANLGKLSGKIEKAMEQGLKDTIVEIANTVIKVHPWKTRTGNNSRSIKYEQKGLTGAVFSTSGYGGYLETGTRNADNSQRMIAYPYFKPAVDRHLPNLGKNIKSWIGRNW